MAAPTDLLHPDRFLDPDPGIRALARTLYRSVADLPLVCPHGHVEPSLLALDEPFPEPTALLLLPDHYVLRMLYSHGVPLETLGVPTVDGSAEPVEPRAAWRLFAERYDLFLGTPTRAWLDHELFEVLGVTKRLDASTADAVYDEISERLRDEAFRPRALFDRFRIEVLTTTDAATDSLEHHAAIRNSGWSGRVLPCFRPDALLHLAAPPWREAVDRLSAASGIAVDGYPAFIRAIEERREFFRSMGATSTDCGVESPYTHRLSDTEAAAVFDRALAGRASEADQAAFLAHMLMEMARMSVEDRLVMQIHPGSLRNHNRPLFERFGPDRGGDIPLAAEFTRGLRELLCAYGNDPRLRLVLFTLDESTYARELAPIAGHYAAVRLGPPWWFHDSLEGMRRYREQVTETAGFFNTAGFNDDTRAFLSIPARHDLARRMDAGFVARLIARHQVTEVEGLGVMRALAYHLARETYRLEA
jgi:glucuronate isomerase